MANATVIALHCSLGSGRQWKQLTEALGDGYRVIAPDLSGYGRHMSRPIMPVTLADEAALLGEQLDGVDGPIHLVGHSYGGAVAFKMATSEPWAGRHPQPDADRAGAADFAARQRHRPPAQRCVRGDGTADLFRSLERHVHGGARSLPRVLERLGAERVLPGEARLRMIEHIEKVAFDFTAILGEDYVAEAASALRVPTLLVSGGTSPYMTQRIVAKLAALIPGAETRHVTSAGHMLPITHAKQINPDIAAHIDLDDFSRVLLAVPPEAMQRRLKERHLRLLPG